MAERKGGDKSRDKLKGGSNSRSGKSLGRQDIYVGEELKIAVNVAIDRFRNNEEKELEFPSSLTANERAYVHRHCQDLGLISKSRGKGNKRFLTVFKVKEESASVHGQLFLTAASENQISSLLSCFPVTNRDRHELTGQKLHKKTTEQNKILTRENKIVLKNLPSIPPEPKANELHEATQRLPIHEFKDTILKSITENQVVFIAGDTGSGKTTQVGKFILESCAEKKSACRIICTQPRRLSAMSIAERVAAERGEQIGCTVGYQVRLESKISPKTLLQFCTNGVLLRLLMVGHKCLSNITHIIVDEIHERDVFIDFLLISLRDLLKTYKKLKIVLMSAALNVDLFTSYFGSCPFINIPGSCHEVKKYFLEDILKQTSYLSKGMQKLFKHGDEDLFKQQICSNSEAKVVESSNASLEISVLNHNSDKKNQILNRENDVEIEGESGEENKKNREHLDQEVDPTDLNQGFEELEIEAEGLDDVSAKEQKKPMDHGEDTVVELSEEMNTALAQAWLNGDDEAFDQIIHLIMNENIPIDYQHTETKMTALIVAAARGKLTLAEQLIELGAKLDICDPKNNRDAAGWARHFNQNHVAEYLKGVISGLSNGATASADDEIKVKLDDQDKRRLELYHKSFDDQKVDINLILSLLNHICLNRNSLDGAILVFLPGYDEIMTLNDRLLEDSEFCKREYHILLLHSMLPAGNQRKVFAKSPKGTRKIILSTNIAETSVTIDDVVYVIDSGKIKEKSHDALASVSSLRTVWISKSSAIQRRGRAGRCSPGVCYHLFSQDRFQHFQMYQDAEILRVPLHELCLQTKMLAPVNVSISDYLSKAPEPPSNLMIRNSIQLLKAISALDENEDMTDLGKVLVELPIDPQLGKMILVGMILKCLEPAVVIACCCSYKEPFLLPTIASQKSSAANCKYKLSSGSYSDQIAMLEAFQGWQKARRTDKDKYYCTKNFISPGTMEMVFGMRRQIITQLRNLGFVNTNGPGGMKELNTNSRNWAVVKAAIAAALYPNFIKVDRSNLLLVSEREKKVNIHNSSVIMAKSEEKVQSTVSRANKLKSIVSSLPFDWLVYEEVSRLYYSVQIRSVSVISPVAVSLVGGPSLSYEHSSLRLKATREKGKRGSDRAREAFFQESDSEQEDNDDSDVGSTFKIDDWIAFTADDNVLNSVAMLRIKFLSVFSKHIQLPPKPWSEADDAIVQCVTNVLTKEDQAAGLPNPAAKEIEKKLSVVKRSDKHAGRGERYDSYGSSPRGSYRGGYSNEVRGRGRGGYSRPAKKRDLRDQKGFENESNKVSDKDKTKYEKRYFIIKCNNAINMGISFERSIWATTKINEKKLDEAFHNSKEVLLIFSVQFSSHFQGVARMASGISNRHCPDFGSKSLGGVFDVEWIHKEEIPFHVTQHLTNPLNENKKVQVSRDTQELETSVGGALVSLWQNPLEASSHSHRKRHLHSPRHNNAAKEDKSNEEDIERETKENQFYSGAHEAYEDGDSGNYVEGYQIYTPPPFSPQFIPEFPPQVSPQFGPPPTHMAYQQPYMYASTGGIPPNYREHGYYPVPQYSSPRREGDPDVYGPNAGQYTSHESRNRNSNYRS